MLDTTIQRALAGAIESNAEPAVHGIDRGTLTHPETFQLEMQYIFEGNWIYLAHESQLHEGNGYFRTWIGRHPALIARTRNGKLNAFVNPSGRRSHYFVKVARFESYRGFLFASLNSDVTPLGRHLGAGAKIIDLMMDQSPQGLEVLRGALTRISNVNWKHPANSVTPDCAGGDTRFEYFDTGHLKLQTQPRLRSLCLYPNLLVTDQSNSQIRHYRPLAVNQTEVTIHCIAPKGESSTARVLRLREYEDFCNAGGLSNDEEQGLFGIQHWYWRDAMRRALASERRL